MEISLQNESVTVETPSRFERDASGRPASRARAAIRWVTVAPWLTAAALALVMYLGWFAYDLRQHRLHDGRVQFDAATRRFEHYWPLRDAAVEAALALKWDLAAAPTAPTAASRPASAAVDLRALDADARRFGLRSDELLREIAASGVLTPDLASAYRDAASRLSGELADAVRAGEASAPPAALAQAREQVRRVLAALAEQGRQARERQAMSAVFLDEVEDVRSQMLAAFAVIVTLLVLALAFATQWVQVARRERALRGRAEHLAEVAASERARAEQVARDKARFLGMLSHELLTPLQSIWSTMDVIESRGRVDARDPAFTRLKESMRSLRGRISDLVDFAKMSSGRLETRVRGFQFDKLVDIALRDVEEALASKNLDVHWDPDPDLGRRIYSDPARLRQIVDNLLSNAVKYTERGGISIHAQLLQDTTRLRLEVSDTGVGIQPEALARLFEPFYRAPATAAMAEGSGLGLAVVRRLVDLMGGDIRVRSRPRQGTSILVEVPVSECVEGPIDAPGRIEARLPVLVVDDSRDARRALADVIRGQGIDVHEAGSGTAGLAEARRRDYLAILLDLQMPDLSGYEVAQRLRQPGGRHARTFMILVSAYNDLDEATVDGLFDARIDKPASQRDLMMALARASAMTEAAHTLAAPTRSAEPDEARTATGSPAFGGPSPPVGPVRPPASPAGGSGHAAPPG